MLIEQVRELAPLDRLGYWVTERESIRRKKEAGAPPPWTDDEILRRYRFCNVRRMDDRVSRWLLENWYRPHRGYAPGGMLAAAAVARFFNKEATLEVLTRHVFTKSGRPHLRRAAAAVRKLKSVGGPVFNAAYMVRGNDGADKVAAVLDHYVRPLVRLGARGAVDPDSMRRTWENILPSYGLGSFMAGQIVADVRWAVPGRWADRHRWAPVGPGSARGMNWVHGRAPGDPAGRANWEEEFPALTDRLRAVLPAGITGRLEAHDYQNCLCETDKYNRVLFGLGRPKQLYAGAG